MGGWVCVCVGGWGGLGTSPPTWVPLSQGAVGHSGLMVQRPLISSGDRPHHTAPHCWQPLSREVPLPPSGGGCWAPPPTLPSLPSHLSLFLGGWKAWQDWDHEGLIGTFSRQLPTQKPRLSLRATGPHGGRSMAGPGSQLGFRRGVSPRGC